MGSHEDDEDDDFSLCKEKIARPKYVRVYFVHSQYSVRTRVFRTTFVMARRVMAPRDGPPRDGPPRDGPPRDGPRDGPPRDGQKKTKQKTKSADIERRSSSSLIRMFLLTVSNDRAPYRPCARTDRSGGYLHDRARACRIAGRRRWPGGFERRSSHFIFQF